MKAERALIAFVAVLVIGALIGGAWALVAIPAGIGLLAVMLR